MSRWKQIKEDNDTLKFECTAAANRRIIEIYLYLHHPKVTLSLTLTPECYQSFQNYFEYHAEFGFSNPNGLFMTDMGYHCTLTFDEVLEKDVLDRFLSEVLRFEPSVMEIVTTIKQSLKAEEYYGIAQDISRELAHGHFSFILESAKHLYKIGTRDVLLKLAEKCFDLNYFTEGLSSLEAIEEGDKVGNFRAAHLILKADAMPEKIMNRYELALKHLFKSGNDPIVQKLRDKIFAGCVGEPDMTKVPSIQGIRLNDPDVFVTLGDEVRKLNEHKKKLQHQVETLQQKLQNWS